MPLFRVLHVQRVGNILCHEVSSIPSAWFAAAPSCAVGSHRDPALIAPRIRKLGLHCVRQQLSAPVLAVLSHHTFCVTTEKLRQRYLPLASNNVLRKCGNHVAIALPGLFCSLMLRRKVQVSITAPAPTTPGSTFLRALQYISRAPSQPADLEQSTISPTLCRNSVWRPAGLVLALPRARQELKTQHPEALTRTARPLQNLPRDLNLHHQYKNFPQQLAILEQQESPQAMYPNSRRS